MKTQTRKQLSVLVDAEKRLSIARANLLFQESEGDKNVIARAVWGMMATGLHRPHGHMRNGIWHSSFEEEMPAEVRPNEGAPYAELDYAKSFAWIKSRLPLVTSIEQLLEIV